MTISCNDYRSLDAMGLAQSVRRRDISRKKVVEAAVARMNAINQQVNAIVYLHTPALDPAPRESQGDFAGVPYFIKDPARSRIRHAADPWQPAVRGRRARL